MEQILIPGIEAFERRQQRAYAAMGYKAPKEDRDGPERYPVLAGLATNRIEMFSTNVFSDSLASRRQINLQLDHDGGTVVASTTSGLELMRPILGWSFASLRHARNAGVIHSIVDGGNRAAVSVAYRIEQEHEETYAGYKVRVIDRAALQEVSLCRRGVVSEAFAYTSNDACNPSIDDLHTTAMFALCRAQHNVRRANAAIPANTADLTARINRLSAKYGLPPI
jgi:hypothetical protein